ncbi:histidine phosphatase family protein [Paracoccus caeni]|uniref:Histidine phosphatase family protein n=1 Tax=Paracoccus caeni TaxID=657651 RepID=A0A934SA40_9RHOB|nr:histidine phosphatase family protein [Paracoccus caeni]MBK4215165.1 histidine phosphatase family protein [Paracoccus caeni]
MTYPDLYLMRHGQTLWNAEQRMQGRLDSALTELGKTQAAALAPLVAPVEGQRWASPQGRAMATADLVFAGSDYRTDPRLVEIDVGDFSGHRFDDLRTRHPETFAGDHWAWYDRAPNGEHFAGLEARVRSFLDELQGPAVIVTHGITLRMMRLVAMGRSVAQIGELPLEQGAVHIVRSGQHETWRVDPLKSAPPPDPAG